MAEALNQFTASTMAAMIARARKEPVLLEALGVAYATFGTDDGAEAEFDEAELHEALVGHLNGVPSDPAVIRQAMTLAGLVHRVDVDPIARHIARRHGIDLPVIAMVRQGLTTCSLILSSIRTPAVAMIAPCDAPGREWANLLTIGIALGEGSLLSRDDLGRAAIVLGQRLPETVLTALVGQPIGRLLRHPLLEAAGATIEAVATRGDTPIVTLGGMESPESVFSA